MFKFNNGDKVKDRLTGFVGIVACRTEFLNGCIRYGLQPIKLLKDGTPAAWEHIDEGQLEMVKAAACSPKKEPRTGGPAPAPEREPNPTR